MWHLRCISAASSLDQCMYQGSSSAACLGGNITSPLGWTSWSTVAVVVRVLVAQGVVSRQELLSDVGEVFIEPIGLHVVFDARQGVVFLFDFGHDGLPVDFQFCVLFVVVVVLLDFGECGGVVKATGHLSQSVEGAPPGLEEFNEPPW